MRAHSVIHVGCAGWSIPKAQAELFPTEGTHLQRYAARFPAVEINSSFYRLHRAQTYARWAASTPAHFRFAVKMPRGITHYGRLKDASGLAEFLAGPRELGEKLGPLLVQLPPSLAFERDVAEGFFATLREQFEGYVACEPRHASWFEEEAEALLRRFRIARVAADPAPVPQAARPGGWSGLVYYRLHGSPRMHYSAYSDAFLDDLAQRLAAAAASAEVWCVFNNTAAGAAIENAMVLLNMQIKVIRSARRKKTISARMEGDVMVVRAPAHISEEELQKAIENLRGRLQRRMEAATLSNNDLETRARALNRQYFGGKLRWRSIRWVTNQNKRYGSCTPATGEIRISHRLAKVPAWVLDYVLVHELAHLQEPNHGPRFWKLVNRYPRTERARGYLMALGLEEDEGSAFGET